MNPMNNHQAGSNNGMYSLIYNNQMMNAQSGDYYNTYLTCFTSRPEIIDIKYQVMEVLIFLIYEFAYFGTKINKFEI